MKTGTGTSSKLNCVKLRMIDSATGKTVKMVNRIMKGAIIIYAVLLRRISFSVHCAFVMSLRAVGFGELFTAAAFCDMFVLSL